jgi:predicted ATPase
VDEQVHVHVLGEAPKQVLQASDGRGWWWSGDDRKQVPLKLESTACAFAAAAADASFPAGATAAFVRGWGFFDPSPVLLRRASSADPAATLVALGRNLAARLFSLLTERPADFDRVVSATKNILGVPQALDFRVTEQGIYFTQAEPGLEYRVHQIGASSGTLRILALMTALLGESEAGLIGIEEPENHVHPAALEAFAEYLRACAAERQIIVTTHSPLLLDYLGTPEAVCVVRRTDEGTVATREDQPEAVKTALRESGFALGEFYETKGFGA